MKIYVSTPTTDQSLSGGWIASMAMLEAVCRTEGISLRKVPRFGMSDLICCRNIEFGNFLASDEDKFITFDSDEWALPEDFLALIKSPHMITAAPVPRKHLEWPVINEYAKLGHDEPELAAATFNFKVRPKGDPLMDGLYMQIACAGFGLMSIDRSVLMEMTYHCKWFMNEGVPMPELCGRFFIDEKALYPEQLSEDFSFCMKAKEWIDEDTWLYWPARVGHIGSKVYRGVLHT